MAKKRGRPKSSKEVLSVGLTITITESENIRLKEYIKTKEIPSMNQFFRDLLNKKLELEELKEKQPLEMI